jgi:hypothetical protein
LPIQGILPCYQNPSYLRHGPEYKLPHSNCFDSLAGENIHRTIDEAFKMLSPILDSPAKTGCDRWIVEGIRRVIFPPGCNCNAPLRVADIRQCSFSGDAQRRIEKAKILELAIFLLSRMLAPPATHQSCCVCGPGLRYGTGQMPDLPGFLTEICPACHFSVNQPSPCLRNKQSLSGSVCLIY